MGFFNKVVKALFPGSAAGSTKVVWVYTRCNQCGEALAARVDLHNDLSRSDDDRGFIARKVLIGSNRCFRQIELFLEFDGKRNLTKRVVTGGTFIDKDEYAAGVQQGK